MSDRLTIKKRKEITRYLTDRVHCEGRLPSPGIVSPWEAVLFIQRVGQTPFY